MKRGHSLLHLLPVFVLLAASLGIFPQSMGAAERKTAERNAVKIEDLNAPGGVLGMLALPLGKVVTVEGEIIDGAKLRMKSLEGVWLLQVNTVNGQKLPVPCALRFGWSATAGTRKLTGRVKLIGYESGQFVGLPPDAFSHIAPVAAEGFHFESSFVVLKSL